MRRCLIVLPLLVACGAAPGEPTVPELDDGWNEQLPGGLTGCSYGTEFAWWVRPGTVNKVVVDFWGGGACWDDITCAIGPGQIFEDSVDNIRTAIEDDVKIGIYDETRDDNPFADWFHVIVPYCTGDIHWGDNRTRYGNDSNDFALDHVGAVNARAVLDQVYSWFSAPEQIFVTGCSAGSYGSALWSADLMRQYPEADVIQFGDSGAGVITDQFFADSFPTWNAEPAFPSWIPSLDPATEDLQGKELADLYVGIADANPTARMAQYNTWADGTQVDYFQFMGGGDEALWTERMQESIATIEAASPNFHSFVAPGEEHCIVLRDGFYTVESDGVRLVDWVGDLIDGDPGSVECDECQ